MSVLFLLGFPGSSVVKNLSANAGTAGDSGSIPRSGRSSREGKVTHPSIITRINSWTEKSGRLQSMGLQSQTQLSIHALLFLLECAAVQVKACLTKFGLKAERYLRGNLCCAVLTRALFIYSFISFQKSRHGAPLSCNYLNEFLYPVSST